MRVLHIFCQLSLEKIFSSDAAAGWAQEQVGRDGGRAGGRGEPDAGDGGQWETSAQVSALRQPGGAPGWARLQPEIFREISDEIQRDHTVRYDWTVTT